MGGTGCQRRSRVRRGHGAAEGVVAEPGMRSQDPRRVGRLHQRKQGARMEPLRWMAMGGWVCTFTGVCARPLSCT